MIQVIRVYHPAINNAASKCFMFDIESTHFGAWKGGGIGLTAEFIRLPNGKKPEPLTSLQCGTCNTTHFKLSELIFETIIIP